MKHKRVELTTQVELNATLRESIKKRSTDNGDELQMELNRAESSMQKTEAALEQSQERVVELQHELDSLRASVETQLREASAASLESSQREAGRLLKSQILFGKIGTLLHTSNIYIALTCIVAFFLLFLLLLLLLLSSFW